MGLDMVEYIIAIEDAFELSIPNADAPLVAIGQRVRPFLRAVRDRSRQMVFLGYGSTTEYGETKFIRHAALSPPP